MKQENHFQFEKTNGDIIFLNDTKITIEEIYELMRKEKFLLVNNEIVRVEDIKGVIMDLDLFVNRYSKYLRK